MFTLGDVADILDSALDTGISIVDALAKLSDLADEGSLGSAKALKFQSSESSYDGNGSENNFDENGNIINLGQSVGFINNGNKDESDLTLISDDSGVCSGNSITSSGKTHSESNNYASEDMPTNENISCAENCSADINTCDKKHIPHNKSTNVLHGCVGEIQITEGSPVDSDKGESSAVLEENSLEEIPVFQAFGDLCHLADDFLNYNKNDYTDVDRESNSTNPNSVLNMKVNDMLQSFQKLDATVEKLKYQAMQRHLIRHPGDKDVLNTQCLRNSDPGPPVILRQWKPVRKRPHTLKTDVPLSVDANTIFVNDPDEDDINYFQDYSYSGNISEVHPPVHILPSSDTSSPVNLRKTNPDFERPQTYTMESNSPSSTLEFTINDSECDMNYHQDYSELLGGFQNEAPNSYIRRASQETYICDDCSVDNDDDYKEDLNLSQSGNGENQTFFSEDEEENSRPETYVLFKENRGEINSNKSGSEIDIGVGKSTNKYPSKSPLFYKETGQGVKNNEGEQKSELVIKNGQQTAITQSTTISQNNTHHRQTYILCSSRQDHNTHTTNPGKPLNVTANLQSNNTFLRKKTDITKLRDSPSRQTYIVSDSEDHGKNVHMDDNRLDLHGGDNKSKVDRPTTYILSKSDTGMKKCKKSGNRAKSVVDKTKTGLVKSADKDTSTVVPGIVGDENKFKNIEEHDFPEIQRNKTYSSILPKTGSNPEKCENHEEFKKCDQRMTYTLYNPNHKSIKKRKKETDHSKTEMLENANNNILNKSNPEVMFYVGKRIDQKNEKPEEETVDASLSNKTEPEMNLFVSREDSQKNGKVDKVTMGPSDKIDPDIHFFIGKRQHQGNQVHTNEECTNTAKLSETDSDIKFFLGKSKNQKIHISNEESTQNSQSSKTYANVNFCIGKRQNQGKVVPAVSPEESMQNTMCTKNDPEIQFFIRKRHTQRSEIPNVDQTKENAHTEMEDVSMDVEFKNIAASNNLLRGDTNICATECEIINSSKICETAIEESESCSTINIQNKNTLKCENIYQCDTNKQETKEREYHIPANKSKNNRLAKDNFKGNASGIDTSGVVIPHNPNVLKVFKSSSQTKTEIADQLNIDGDDICNVSNNGYHNDTNNVGDEDYVHDNTWESAQENIDNSIKKEDTFVKDDIPVDVTSAIKIKGTSQPESIEKEGTFIKDENTLGRTPNNSYEILGDTSSTESASFKSKYEKLYSRTKSLDTLIDNTNKCMLSSRFPFTRSFSNPSSSTEVKEEFDTHSGNNLFQNLGTLQNLMSSSLTKLNTINHYRKKNSCSFILSSQENVLEEATCKQFYNCSNKFQLTGDHSNSDDEFSDSDGIVTEKNNNIESITSITAKDFTQNSIKSKEVLPPYKLNEKNNPVLINDIVDPVRLLMSSTPNSSNPPSFDVTDEMCNAPENIDAYSGIKCDSYEEEYFPETYTVDTIDSDTSSMCEIFQQDVECNNDNAHGDLVDNSSTNLDDDRSKVLPLSDIFFSSITMSEENGPSKQPGISSVSRSDTFVLSPKEEKVRKEKNNSNTSTFGVSRNDTFLIDKNSKCKQDGMISANSLKHSFSSDTNSPRGKNNMEIVSQCSNSINNRHCYSAMEESHEKIHVPRRPYSAGCRQKPPKYGETSKKIKNKSIASEGSLISDIGFSITKESISTPVLCTTGISTNEAKSENGEVDYLSKHSELKSGSNKSLHSSKRIPEIEDSQSNKLNKRNPVGGNEVLSPKKAPRKKLPKVPPVGNGKRRSSEPASIHTDFLRRKSEGFSKNKQNKENEDETLSVQLAALRMQLEEKRRKFDEEKKRKQEQWREERAKNLQNAFFIMLNNEEEKTVEMSVEHDQNWKESTTSYETQTLNEEAGHREEEIRKIIPEDKKIPTHSEGDLENTQKQEVKEPVEENEVIKNNESKNNEWFDQIHEESKPKESEETPEEKNLMRVLTEIEYNASIEADVAITAVAPEQYPVKTKEANGNSRPVELQVTMQETIRPLSSLLEEFSPVVHSKADISASKQPVGFAPPDSISTVLSQLGNSNMLQNDCPQHKTIAQEYANADTPQLSMVLNELDNNTPGVECSRKVESVIKNDDKKEISSFSSPLLTTNNNNTYTLPQSDSRKGYQVSALSNMGIEEKASPSIYSEYNEVTNATIGSVLDQVSSTHLSLSNETEVVDTMINTNNIPCIPTIPQTRETMKETSQLEIKAKKDTILTDITANKRPVPFEAPIDYVGDIELHPVQQDVSEKTEENLISEVKAETPLAMAFSVGVDMMGCPELTPQQVKKRERFLRQREKKMMEEKAKKAAEIEMKQRMEEMAPPKIAEEHPKQLSRQEQSKETNNLYQGALAKRLGTEQAIQLSPPATPLKKGKRELTTPRTPRTQQHATTSTSTPTDEQSPYAEYKGPEAYKKPSGKSNRKIIQNAIMHCCLCGEVNKESKKKCLEAMEKSEANHFLVLFREGLKFRSVYGYLPEIETVTKVYGIGPKNLNEKMMNKYYKYNSGGKEFYSLETKHLSIQVDGLMIRKELWDAKKTPGSKTDSNLKKSIGNQKQAS